MIAFALVLGVLSSPLFAQTENFDNILFLHHSTGYNLIAHGNVRGLIDEYNSQHGTNLQFWDHDYNSTGLRDPAGNYGYGSYDIPNDNTNPDGLYDIFVQPLHSPPDNAFSRIMLPHHLNGDTVTHEIFIYKSCFPASDISSEEMLLDYQNWYLAMRNIMDAHPEKLFIPFTPPPLVRNATTPENAARARRFANWLSSDTYLGGHRNIFTFNFWSLLAEHDSTSLYYDCLREAYGGSGGDSHPNYLANSTIGPIFVTHITNSISIYTEPASSDRGDLNCNGFSYEIADAVIAMSILQNRQGIPLDSCVRANSDIDQDGDYFTVGDICQMFNIINGSSLPPVSPRLNEDSLIVSSVNVRPGDTAEVELYISVADSLIGFQIALGLDSSYFSVLNFVPGAQLPESRFVNLRSYSLSIDCIFNAYGFSYIQPGRYHIGTLRVAISASAPEGATGNFVYRNDTQSAIYTGIAICSDTPLYFQNPILVNGQVFVEPEFLPGDANGSDDVNGLDVNYLVAYFKGGPPIPNPVLRADANGSCSVNGLDVVYLVSYFKGGPAPYRGDCGR